MKGTGWVIGMADTEETQKTLMSLVIHVDDRGQIHTFADGTSTWVCLQPLSAAKLMTRYIDRLAADDDGTTVKVQADRKGQVYSYTDAHSTWIFENPIPVSLLVEKYIDVLANVSMELKVPVPKSARNRARNTHWPIP